MGDSRRGQIFAQFIVRQFPKARCILDIASGKGQVARKLVNKGKVVTAMEAYPRLEGRAHPRIKYIAGYFTEDSEVGVHDLIVGMHPDEATSEIIRYATLHMIPFAVVPCCVKGRHSTGLRYVGWLLKLEDLARHGGMDVCRMQLKITGKNTVIVGKPRK